MPNVHTTLTSLFSAIANAIRGKTGSSAQIVADDFPDAIDAIPTGTPLPALTDPASASDILDGKEAIDGQGQVLTGTLVPPVDTGANGLYKAMIQGEITSINDSTLTSAQNFALTGMQSVIFKEATRARSPASVTALQTYIVPKLAAFETRMFSGCTNLKNVWCPIATGAKGAGHTGNQRLFLSCSKIEHLYLGGWEYIGYWAFDGASSLKSLTFDNLMTFSNQGGAPAIETLIIRKSDTTLQVKSALTGTKIASGEGYIYVPAADVSSYQARTNWTTYANQIVGIDEDTTCAVGQTFVPTTTATGIDHWDMVDLQSYSAGTVDTTNGSITPTHDGRLLIRGLDANDEIVHVTYLQIGTGFDEEANLA